MTERTMTLPAVRENHERVQAFFEECLEEAGFPLSGRMLMLVAAEEVFVNIASYAYGEGGGDATVSFRVAESPRRAVFTFEDAGAPFDPHSREDPDITLGADARDIGGLGIFMTRRAADRSHYERRGDRNVFSFEKGF